MRSWEGGKDRGVLRLRGGLTAYIGSLRFKSGLAALKRKERGGKRQKVRRF
jgi:hypothetical protein